MYGNPPIDYIVMPTQKPETYTETFNDFEFSLRVSEGVSGKIWECGVESELTLAVISDYETHKFYMHIHVECLPL